jgi:hypothetical protein
VRLQRVPGHAAALTRQRIEVGDGIAEPIRFHDHERQGPAQGAVRLGGKVFFEQLFDLLLSSQVFRRAVRGQVETEPDGVAILEKVPAGAAAAQRHLFALIILEQQFDPFMVVVQMPAQVGVGQGGRQHLSIFQLNDLVGQVFSGAGIGGGKAQAGKSAMHRLAVEHGQKGRFADPLMAEDADPLRPTEPIGFFVDACHGPNLRKKKRQRFL